MKNLIREVHRRSLWQVLGIYLAGSWIALQVVEQLAEAANLPAWVRPAALALLILGFPIVMATAFVQEGLSSREPHAGGSTPEAPAEGAAGVAPAVPAAAPSPTGAARVFTWRNALIGGGAAFALWGIAVSIMMLLGVGPAGGGGSVAGGASGDRIAIAVLPFENRGDDEQSQVFSLGIHDDLLTRLSKIASLRVTSRTSVMGYRDAPKPIPEIARELGVDYVLEGSVLGAGGQVNINAQLIDGRSDEHLWAETYNRALTVSNVFAIQKDLAQRITESLSAALLPEEAAEIEAPPTENMEAYNAFLRGHTFFQEGPRSDDFDAAIEMYERAVELDPDFAEAHARLSYALGMKYEIQGIGDPEVLAQALEHAQRALDLDSDLPEASLAFGQYYYSGERNLPLAMEYLTRAGQANFHSADVFHLLGAVQRRMGDLDGAIASWEEMVRIDPLSAHYYDDLASTYYYAARWDDFERADRQWAELDPRTTAPISRLAHSYIDRGDLERAEAVLDSVDAEKERFSFVRWQLAVLRRDWDAALSIAGDGRLLRAQTLDLIRDPRARPLLDSMRVQGEESRDESPDQALPYSRLAPIYAALGMRDEAVAAADRAIELSPVSSDFLDGPDYVWTKVLVHARLGEVDPALDALEQLVSNKLPGDYTTPYLELEPALDPIRENPRFATLLARNAAGVTQ